MKTLLFFMFLLTIFGFGLANTFDFSQCSLQKPGFVPSEKYVCTANSSLSIATRPDSCILSVTVNHLASYTNVNVEGISFQGANIKSFPRGLPKIFKNIVLILIGSTGITKLQQADLQCYDKLEFLDFYRNPITVLERDLFKYNPNLKFISFMENQITHIHPNVLDNLIYLNEFWLRDNPVYVNNEAYFGNPLNISVIKNYIKTNVPSPNAAVIPPADSCDSCVSEECSPCFDNLGNRTSTLISQQRVATSNRLDLIVLRLNAIDLAVRNTSTSITNLGQELNSRLTTQFNSINSQYQAIQTFNQNILTRFNRLETRILQLETSFNCTIQAFQNEVSRLFRRVNDRIDRNSFKIDEVKSCTCRRKRRSSD